MSKISNEIAELLEGIDYMEWRMERTSLPDTFKKAKDHRCVIIYGASDDLMEFRGAIDEEIGAWEGREAHITQGEFLERRSIECKDCTYYNNEKDRSIKVTLEWDKNGYSWWTDASVPYSEFFIYENDEEDKNYCRGIVIDLNEAREWKEAQG